MSMTNTPSVKTMRLRYAGSCAACGAPVAKGEVAHYLRESKTVRCTVCGPGNPEVAEPAQVAPPTPAAVPEDDVVTQLTQDPLPRRGACDDCGRRLQRGVEAVFDPRGSAILCMECVALDTVHALGTPGAGARVEYAKRLQRHQSRVRTAHPKLGGLILALKDDPSHVTAWETGAGGEEQFGQRLSGIASESLMVLHDRKLPRSAANIDHLAVTSQSVWILDSKHYKDKRVETRGHGLFSRRPPDLYVGGRNQTKLVTGVQRQAEVVREVLEPLRELQALPEIPVRGALVFIDAEFGLFSSPFLVDGVWVGWGKAIRWRLIDEEAGPLPVGVIAKHLARALRPGSAER